jgi:hypothetical protein
MMLQDRGRGLSRRELLQQIVVRVYETTGSANGSQLPHSVLQEYWCRLGELWTYLGERVVGVV